MPHLNIEIKARCSDPSVVRERLQQDAARFVGTDHQVDTYFKSKNGRLKFREGNIEYALIYYERSDEVGPKQSNVTLFHPERGSPLKQMLAHSMGVDIVVDKEREIYFIDNVKFHIDNVAGLGSFVEIEAIDSDGEIGVEALRKQCEHYLSRFDIAEEDLLRTSYSDMLRPGADA